MRALAPVGAEHHPHRERRPIFLRTQRAEIVRDALGQHRHDPVGEIDRVAALERLPVQRRAGPHVGRDVGDGDGDDEAAGVGGIGIGLGVDGVVVVLGVGRIDGDERQARASPRAAGRGGRALRVSASFAAAGEKTCGMWCWASAIRLTAFSDLTEPSRSTIRAAGGPKRAVAQGFDRDEIAVLGLAGEGGGDEKLAARGALLDRQRAARAVLRPPEDGERARLQFLENLDHPPRIGGLAASRLGVELDPHQHPCAEPGRGAASRFLPPARRTRMRGARPPRPIPRVSR